VIGGILVQDGRTVALKRKCGPWYIVLKIGAIT
jgi:hypothetical protein